MKTIEPKPGCLSRALEIIGDKWTPLLLRDLAHAPATFTSLEKSLATISPRTLSKRLKLLETNEIIQKKCYCSHPPRFEYELTPKGKDLEQVLARMAAWGAKYSK